MTALLHVEDLIHQNKKHATTRDVFLVEHMYSQSMMIMMMAFFLLLVIAISRTELEENLLKKGFSLK